MKLLVCVCAFLYANYATAQYTRCTNPNQRAGLCVKINDCQTLHSVLQRPTLSATEKQFIRESDCGMDSNNIRLFCCTRDTGYTRSRRLTPIFEDYGDYGERNDYWPASSVSPPRGSDFRPWTFNNNNNNIRPVWQRQEPNEIDDNGNAYATNVGLTTSDGSSLLPQPPSCGGVAIINKIYGGQDTDLNEFPWLVLMEYRRISKGGALSTNCAGSLINQRYVLTAAHCVTGRIEREIGPLNSVRLGEHDTRTTVDCSKGACSEAQRLGIAEARPHELYSEQSKNQVHDIALVRLERSVRYSSSVRPICLPSAVGALAKQTGQQYTVAGWGRTLNQVRSPVKQKLVVNYMEPAQCRQKFGERQINIEATQLCAGGKYAQDSCDGDSGGPLMSFRSDAWVLEGIVSFGHKCGLKDWPGVYTNVAAYDIWIRQHVRP